MPAAARKARILVAKPGLDGHDRGANMSPTSSGTPASR